MIGLTRFIFRFTGIFLLVVVGLYADMLVSSPKDVLKDIFAVGFPWNLMILTALIYAGFSITSALFRGLKRIL